MGNMKTTLKARRLLKLVVLPLLAAFSNVALAVDVSFNPPSLTLNAGEEALVVVEVSDVQAPGLAAFQFDLNFDPAVVHLSDPNSLLGAREFQPLGAAADALICGLLRGPVLILNGF